MSNPKKIKNFFRKDGKFTWGCIKKVKNYPCSSVEIYIKELKDSLDLDSVWTIISDNDGIYEDNANSNYYDSPVIVVAHSHKFIQIHVGSDDSKIEYEEVWPANAKMPKEVEDKINDAQKNGMNIKRGNAWDSKLISKIVSDWVWRQTGNTVDFFFDPNLSP